MFRKGSLTERYFMMLCDSMDVSTRNGKIIVDLEPEYVPHHLGEFRNLSRMKSMGLLYQDPPGSSTGVLTDKGLAWALVYCLRRRYRLLPKGQVCLAVFDFPENKRHLRKAFRALLRELRFTRIQQSVFVSRQDAAVHLQYYLELLQLQAWVRAYTGHIPTTPKKVRPDQNRSA